jgi:hypothetical protein
MIFDFIYFPTKYLSKYKIISGVAIIMIFSQYNNLRFLDIIFRGIFRYKFHS